MYISLYFRFALPRTYAAFHAECLRDETDFVCFVLVLFGVHNFSDICHLHFGHLDVGKTLKFLLHV